MNDKVGNKMKKSFGEHFRDFFNVSFVQKAFRIGTELISAAQPVIENQTPITIAKSALGVGKVLIDNLELWPDDFFDDSWETPYPADFNGMLMSALANKPYKTLKTSDESCTVHLVQFEDVEVGYIFNKRTNSIMNRIYFPTGKVERARELIKKELWRLMKNDNVVLRHVKRPRANDYEASPVALEVDDAFKPLPSKRASEYSGYLKKCIDAGVSRSVMLYGPPGTGKSTMARTIVDNLGLRSFRIRVEDIGHLETSTIFEAIDMFEPDAVILDDFDRSSEQSALLETLEYFQRHVKLVLATVNHKNRLDEAILRPGRFDELLQVKKMDDDVLLSVLGEEHKDAYEIVKEWPIAFVQEYVKRLRFMSAEEATESVIELANRVKRLKKYDEDEGEDSVLSSPVSSPVKSAKTSRRGESFNEFMKSLKLLKNNKGGSGKLDGAARKRIKKKILKI